MMFWGKDDIWKEYTYLNTMDIWVVYTGNVALYACESPETSDRLVKGVADGAVKQDIAISYNGKWYVPGFINEENAEDKKLRIAREKLEAVLEKASQVLTEEEIEVLRNGR